MGVARRMSAAELARVAGSGRTAIILNANARRVTDRVRQQVETMAAEAERGADVFFTETLEEAASVTQHIARSGYDTVVTGGGDGTVANTIAAVLDGVESEGGAYPRFAVLRLGTGNAVADRLGAGFYEHDLEDVCAEPDALDTRRVDLIETEEGRRIAFGGFGWDAYILNNYRKVKGAAERMPALKPVLEGVFGYLVAGVGKSVPELVVRRPSWEVRVINTGGMAFELAAGGHVVQRFAPGATVFEGRTRLACFGTLPYYGFKFNIMPWADKTAGMFQLRMVDMNPVAAVANLRDFWRGTAEHPGLRDFHLSGCTLEFSEAAPMQIGGDAEGYRERYDLRIAERPIDCVQFGG